VACGLQPESDGREAVAELRRHPLTGDWVVICHDVSDLLVDERQADCIYCPGREALTGKEIYRANGSGSHQGSDWSMRVVAGSPPVLHIEGEFGKKGVGMCDRMEAIGAHEILIESPAHDVEFEDLEHGQILTILDTIRHRAQDLANDPRLKHFLPFKVRALSHGERSLHPRWHMVSAPFVPGLIKHELNAARKYFNFRERCIFCDYVLQERRAASRVIHEDTHVIAVSPYAARVPFEIWVLPLAHSPDFTSISYDEMESLARTLKTMTGSIGRLAASGGYVLTLHTAPFRRPKADAWKTIDSDYHWHIEIDPCINAIGGLIESGGFHFNPVSPEDAAETLAKLRR
jgi:UDPglucose--hexose-1-phosphate uridylyltransferase